MHFNLHFFSKASYIYFIILSIATADDIPLYKRAMHAYVTFPGPFWALKLVWMLFTLLRLVLNPENMENRFIFRRLQLARTHCFATDIHRLPWFCRHIPRSHPDTGHHVNMPSDGGPASHWHLPGVSFCLRVLRHVHSAFTEETGKTVACAESVNVIHMSSGINTYSFFGYS